MKTRITAIGLLVLTIITIATYPTVNQKAVAKLVDDSPKIQLAILLDTSGSMSGLINQTREQLWQMVNQFSKTRKNGVIPTLEVAVYEYGNSGLTSRSGFSRQVSDLTTELDQVSESLFGLTTSGGSEYCGSVIQKAVNELEWSTSDGDIRAIFIAGNEPFTQGPVDYRIAIAAARARGITVNTIHAGAHQVGAGSGWQDGAILAGGEYMSIDHNQKVVHIDAPQDEAIAELNARLNKTYVPYGKTGRDKAGRQERQDLESSQISAGLLSERAAAKSSAAYKNARWDLVDAMEGGEVTLDEFRDEDLPKELRGMKKKEQEAYVQKKAKTRQQIQARIRELSAERDAHIAGIRAAEPAPAVSTFGKAITSAISKEAQKKNYEFKAE